MTPPPDSAPRSARRRFGASLSTNQEPEVWRRALCAALFDDPSKIADALSHPVAGRFVIEAHHHTDLLQLDVIHQCEGQAMVDGRETELSGTTLMTVPPGVMHGYTLRPAGPDAAVWLIKLRIGRDGESALPTLVTGNEGWGSVKTAVAALVSDWTPQGVSLQALTQLALAIGAWPESVYEGERADAEGYDTSATHEVGGDGPSSRVRRAIETLGRRLSDPPDLAELAASANLSPRHFARRFRQDFGCTPHDYLQARRLDAARGLLRDADRRVSSVAEDLGFSSPAAFSRWFTRLAGQSPRTFRDDPQNF
ncbi:helix-turn-helix domain-containing protein [Algisphaera agarilytica]|uniref:AraC family transcriptional regulator n=1 Tax=Algisphaera agarilytica TaxID=1385975 RepID=A0A7X0H4C9_9BACT|nr:AraC family transcriptional regulator [Algisphaera agarilytica]MBB6428827.1 AraC family transcriptional regulator [Algisphaera agarilytica]